MPLMDVAERKLRIGAFQPERVLRERNLQDDVVHLVGARKVGEKPFVRGADDGVGRGDAQFFQHGTSVIGQAFAVTEPCAADIGGGDRLQTADT